MASRLFLKLVFLAVVSCSSAALSRAGVIPLSLTTDFTLRTFASEQDGGSHEYSFENRPGGLAFQEFQSFVPHPDNVDFVARTGTSFVVSANAVAANISDRTYLSASHADPFTNTGRRSIDMVVHAEANIFVDLINTPQIQEKAHFYRGDLSYDAVIAPGDAVSIQLFASFNRSNVSNGDHGRLTTGDTIVNRTDSPMTISGNLGSLSYDFMDEGTFFMKLYARAYITKNYDHAYSQESGVTWVSIDPGMGVGDQDSLDAIFSPPNMVPEPNSFAIYALGTLALIGVRRRKRVATVH